MAGSLGQNKDHYNFKQTWWVNDRGKLLSIADKKSPCYVYNPKIIAAQAKKLLNLTAIDSLFYAIKANFNPEILRILEKQNIGFECVSIGELRHVFKLFPNIAKKRVIFTPNFAPKKEYEYALQTGCHLTIDNIYPLVNWPKLFANHSIILRIDPGIGAGHHKYVNTGGQQAKFGIDQEDLPQVQKILTKYNINVLGLHIHAGSGIFKANHWEEMALLLLKLPFSSKILNLGGGLGICEHLADQPLNLELLNNLLMSLKNEPKDVNYKFWLEPGRFFVAESGVLLAKVTQCKQKGGVKFVGIETGMNSLIRPALYNAYHQIVNLTRLNEPSTETVNIVGPICETADFLGQQRLMPKTYENDILLIANTGAYGFCMSSSYNLRKPAKEIMMD